jgi:hypothetical protein
MKVSKSEAEAIARKRACESLDITLLDGNESNHKFYSSEKKCDYWVAVLNHKFFSGVIEPSEIIVISKADGKILYHGPANDEG